MTIYRYFRSIAYLWGLCCLASAVAQERDWSLSEALPVDDNVTAGQLDNGLKYYIRENKKPEGRVFLRLVVNAGSLQENPEISLRKT